MESLAATSLADRSIVAGATCAKSALSSSAGESSVACAVEDRASVHAPDSAAENGANGRHSRMAVLLGTT